MWEEDGWDLSSKAEEAVTKIRRVFPVRLFWMWAAMGSACLLAITSFTSLLSVGWSPTKALAIIVGLLLLIIYPISVYVEEEKKIKILEVLVNLDGKKVPQL
jgi:drug/metabolite transporter (DMT)-like permease